MQVVEQQTGSSSSAGRSSRFSLCGMCAVRCPIEVQVEGGRVRWLQGNARDAAMGTSLCPKGAAGVAFQADDERPQRPVIRVGARGEGRWREVSWDEALDYVAERLEKVRDRLGPRAIVLSDRGGPFTDLTKSFLKAIGSPNYFDHDSACGANAHHATRSLFGLNNRGQTTVFLCYAFGGAGEMTGDHAATPESCFARCSVASDSARKQSASVFLH